MDTSRIAATSFSGSLAEGLVQPALEAARAASIGLLADVSLGQLRWAVKAVGREEGVAAQLVIEAAGDALRFAIAPAAVTLETQDRFVVAPIPVVGASLGLRGADGLRVDARELALRSERFRAERVLVRVVTVERVPVVLLECGERAAVLVGTPVQGFSASLHERVHPIGEVIPDRVALLGAVRAARRLGDWGRFVSLRVGAGKTIEVTTLVEGGWGAPVGAVEGAWDMDEGARLVYEASDLAEALAARQGRSVAFDVGARGTLTRVRRVDADPLAPLTCCHAFTRQLID